MHWKFWEKRVDGTQEKLSSPKDMPDLVGRYLVLKLGQDPDWVWKLKGVTLRKEGSRDVFHVRIFNPNDASMKKVSVKHYHSLDDYQELILFEGWFDKKTLQAEVQAPSQTKNQAA